MKIAYRQLKIEDREKIAIFRAQGKSVREIARVLGRHHSTMAEGSYFFDLGRGDITKNNNNFNWLLKLMAALS